MPARYRAILAALGLFVLLGGLVNAWSMGYLVASGQRVRAVIGGLIAVAVGGTVMVAAYRGRVPAWLARLVGGTDA